MNCTNGSAGRARHCLGLSAMVATMALTGCSMSTLEPTSKRVETWRWGSVQVGDGPAQTVSSHTVEYQPIIRGPEWDLQAQWYLRDSGAHACPVRLDPAPKGENRFMTTLGNDCSAGMAHIAAWRLQGDTVLLVDAQDTVIGTLNKRNTISYRGSFTLATGETVTASLGRF